MPPFERLRDQVRLESPTQTVDDRWSSPEISWSTEGTHWAAIRSLTGRELQYANASSAELTHRIEMRNVDGVAAGWRAVDVSTSVVYDIEAVLPPRGLNDRVLLLCREHIEDEN